ncbi:ATP-binding protein [Pseudofulvimonas gallinarii]|uniref:histidine kinase n=1 Tax=Pseudofulvimonas gallinarii TaxID=634155 RepID=A0A4R3LIS4_9GAMM|nr:signal transduction histidine kinase [Pseudofulvimonas gallinarii]
MSTSNWWLALALAIGSSGIALADGAESAASRVPEHPLFRQFGTAQGLPSATVFKLAQSRDGSLWIATLDGLARYDGVGFHIWRHDPADPRSVPDNDIEYVLVDSDDRVWIAAQNAGIARYEPDTDSFLRWQHDPADPDSLPGNRVWALADDGDGGLWIGGFRIGLVRMHRDGRFESLREAMTAGPDGCDDIVLAIARGSDGVVWAGTNAGLCRWHPQAGFSRVDIDDLNPRQRVIALRLADDRPWLATQSGLRGAAGLGMPTPPIDDSRGSLSVELEPDGWIWLGTRNGAWRWHPSSGATAVHRARPGHVMSLPAHSIEDILRDQEGSLWFATHGGIAQLVPHWRAIRVYMSESSHQGGLPEGRPRFVTAGGDGQLWVTSDTSRGLSQLDPASGKVTRRFVEGDGAAAPDSNMRAVRVDRRGQLWLGHRAAVSRVLPDGKGYRRFDRDMDGQPLPQTLVRVFAEVDDGLVLAGFGGGGVAWIDDDAGTLQFDPLGVAAGLPCAQAADLHVDESGGVWLACEQGLLRAQAGQRRFRAVSGAPAQSVHGFAFSRDGSIWLHTLGHLGRYRLVDGAVQMLDSVGASDGWPVVDAGGVAIDPAGLVWVNTRRGLLVFDPQTRRISSYGEAHGLPSSEFISVPPAWLAPGLLAAGTTAGVVVVDTSRIRAHLPQSTLRWRDGSVSRRGTLHPLRPGDGQAWQLAYDDRDLRVSVRLGSLLQPDAHRYRFRLDDEPWQEQAGQPERIIDRLPSGRHVLEVDAFGSDGQPAANRLRQVIEVGQPPWRQPWALLLYLLASIAAMLLGQRLYRRRLERRHALVLADERRQWAEQASAAKTRFLAAVGHELRTPMAGLLGMNELLSATDLDARQRHFSASIQRAGGHMLTLVNDLLDLSRIESGQLTLEPRDLDLVACLDQVIGDVAANAESRQLRLSLRIEPGTSLSVRADGKRLHQVLLNLVNNAIKFTAQGHVRVCVSRHDGRHRFEVIDNGPGISDELRHRLFERYSQDEAGRRSGGSGLGLAIARELVELMAGRIDVDAAPGGGSRFWFEVDIGPVHAAAPRDGAARAPRVVVLDDDATRRDDLLTTLRALGIDTATEADADVSALLVADVSAQVAQCLEHARRFKRAVISIPLACPVPALPPSIFLQHGPWALRPLLATLHRTTPMERIDNRRGEKPLAGHAPLYGRCLLLVEDDAILGEVTASQLRRRGAHVDVASDGLAALVAIGSTTYDGIVLDLDLPELDGLQVMELMRNTLQAMPPVVVVTARQQDEDQSMCRARGARAFFRKPVDPDHLVAALGTVISDEGGDSSLTNK